ncbi:hypothetical protein [Allomesorhizobium camelthorni]|uniref:Bacteriophage tail tape measure N-terminal domain-containing protein n=1 Tax=Allomesorhizobium camelthorni TaxID=475069 RepID=A0A6G4W860_9HYPH|nr:hypothetical protein [Mesorhizobium camelthorni]NGO50423.1 hypothetical protein [Mesorhizobium camelthorni]
MNERVVTELVIDGRGAETGSATYIHAMNAAQAAVDRLIDRQKAMDTAVASGGTVLVGSAASTTAAARAFDRLKASIDPTFASAKALERDLITLDRAVMRLGTSESEAGRMLDAVRLKHDAVAQAAKRQADEYMRLAAAGRQAFAADREQGRINTTLGIRGDEPASARASASVFSTELDRMDMVAGLKARQIGQTFSEDLNRSLIAGVSSSARDAAQVFEAEFDRLDTIAQLRAQQIGANFAADLNARMGIGQTAGSARDSASVFATSGGKSLNSNQLQGLSYQANDVITMALLGAPVSQIAASQGGQIFQLLQQGDGGVKGSLAAIKQSAVDAASSVAQMLGPISLVSAGLGVAAAAAGGLYLLMRDEGRTAQEVLERHAKLVDAIAKSYPDAARAAKDYLDAAQRMPASVVAADAQKQQTENLVAYRSALGDIIADLRVAAGAQSQYGDVASAYFAQVATALETDQLQATDLVDILGKIRIQEGPINNAKRLAEMLQDAANEAAKLQGSVQGLDALGAVARGGPLGARYEAGQEQARIAQENASSLFYDRRQLDLDMSEIGARSPQDRAALARAREAARPVNGEDGVELRRFREDAAAALELARANHSLAEAQRERFRSLDATLSAQRLDLDVIGKTVGEVERLRMEFDLTQRVREEAARNGVAADEKELALIREKAAEYGRVADQIARTNLNRDLAFERDQLFRTAGEQQIATRLRGTGIGLDSPEAQQMRAMQEFTELRDGFKGFFTDFKSEVVKSGGDIGEALGNSLLSALNKQLDKELDRLFEQLANSLSSWLLGGSSSAAGSGVAGAGGIVGAVLGGPANDNFSAPVGAVSRGAGGAVDLASNLLGFSEKSPGQINSFLKAGGVDINAAQTAWCAAFVNSSLKQIGVDGTGSLSANSFLNWGTKIDPTKVLQGDVLVKPNGFGIGQTGGHVGLATGASRMGASGLQLEMLSGNTGGPGLGTGGVGLDWVDAAKLDVRRAAQDISQLGGTAAAATKGIGMFGGGLSELGNALISVGGGAGGSGWFSGLMSMFGGVGGATNWMNSISPLATSFIAGGGVGLFHQGGIAGFPTSMRYGVDPRVFIGAPRYHNGGVAGDEVPAILKRGEPVFRSMQHARDVVGNNNQPRAANINITVKGARGNAEIQSMVSAGVQQGLSEYDKVLPGRIGEVMERNG